MKLSFPFFNAQAGTLIAPAAFRGFIDFKTFIHSKSVIKRKENGLKEKNENDLNENDLNESAVALVKAYKKQSSKKCIQRFWYTTTEYSNVSWTSFCIFRCPKLTEN